MKADGTEDKLKIKWMALPTSPDTPAGSTGHHHMTFRKGLRALPAFPALCGGGKSRKTY